MSNYPDGVTGMEDHFGPNKEIETTRFCPECDAEVEGTLVIWNSSAEFICAPHEHSSDADDGDEDPRGGDGPDD